MKFNWFVRKGILFLPVSVIGWILSAAAIIYCVYLFLDIDRRSHSVSDTLINFVFNAFIIALVYSVVAFLTQKKSS